MEVNGLGSVPSAFPVKPAANNPKANQTTEAKPVAQSDQVEISPAGKMLDDAMRSQELRDVRLAQIKAAIESGEYETPEKLEAALDKMLDDIGTGDDS